MDFAITDLPEPDSPTTHKISFAATVSETPSTARDRSDQVGSATVRSAMTRAGCVIGRPASD